jgi:hypothetical protein
MNISKVTKSAVLGLAVLLATGAFASNKANKGSFQLADAATIGGTQVKAGQYQVKWDGDGSNVQLTVMRGSTVVATVPAHLIDLAQKPADDSAIVKRNADGTNTVAEIHFGGKKQALAFGDQMSAGNGSSQ